MREDGVQAPDPRRRPTACASVKVKLDGKTIKTSEKARFTLRVKALNLPRGRHTLKVVARGAGGRTVQRATFFRCKRPALPRFVG